MEDLGSKEAAVRRLTGLALRTIGRPRLVAHVKENRNCLGRAGRFYRAEELEIWTQAERRADSGCCCSFTVSNPSLRLSFAGCMETTGMDTKVGKFRISSTSRSVCKLVSLNSSKKPIRPPSANPPMKPAMANFGRLGKEGFSGKLGGSNSKLLTFLAALQIGGHFGITLLL